MKNLIAVTGPEAEVRAFSLTMMMRHGWFGLDALAPARSAAAAFFGVDVAAFYGPGLDRISPVWGMSYRTMLERTVKTLRAEFGEDVVARRWFNSFCWASETEDVVASGLDAHGLALVAKLGGAVIDLTGRDLDTLALEVAGKVPA